jgi:hypothetical protein
MLRLLIKTAFGPFFIRDKKPPAMRLRSEEVYRAVRIKKLGRNNSKQMREVGGRLAGLADAP